MKIETRFPVRTVTITMADVSADDIDALLALLDQDRNHPVRAGLYDELRRARRALATSTI